MAGSGWQWPASYTHCVFTGVTGGTGGTCMNSWHCSFSPCCCYLSVLLILLFRTYTSGEEQAYRELIASRMHCTARPKLSFTTHTKTWTEEVLARRPELTPEEKILNKFVSENTVLVPERLIACCN